MGLKEELITFGAKIDKGNETPESEAERIRRISNGINVNEGTSIVSLNSPTFFTVFTGLPESLQETNVRRLVDLCSGYTYHHLGIDINKRKEKRLLEEGIEEYIGVDVAVPEDIQGELENSDSQKSFKWSYKKSEALLYLANQPDNSAHIMMCGLEWETTQGNVQDWSLEMFKQMKRVVPDGGVMCLQGFMFKNGVFHLSSLQDAFPNLPYGFPNKISVKGKRADGKPYDPSQFGLIPTRVGEISDGYKFIDEKLGVDWYFFAERDRYRSILDKNESEEVIDTAECHGMPFFLVNKK